MRLVVGGTCGLVAVSFVSNGMLRSQNLCIWYESGLQTALSRLDIFCKKTCHYVSFKQQRHWSPQCHLTENNKIILSRDQICESIQFKMKSFIERFRSSRMLCCVIG